MPGLNLRILRCAIPGCKSTNETVKLFKMPTHKNVSRVWKQILQSKFPDIILTLDKKNRCNRYVCRLHFEDKYILSYGKRDSFAIPTLFTEQEIATKTPEQPISLNRPIHRVTEVRHIINSGDFTTLDHPYACNKISFTLEGLDLPEIPMVDDNTKDKLETKDISTAPDPNAEGEGQCKFKAPEPFSWQNEEQISVEDRYLDNEPLNVDVAEETKINSTNDNVTMNLDVPEEETEINDKNASLEGLDLSELPTVEDVKIEDALETYDISATPDFDAEDDEQYMYESDEPFSWQKEELMSVEEHYLNNVVLNLDVTEENEKNSIKNKIQLNFDSNEANKNNSTKGTVLNKIHQEYYCDNCMEEIISFRYTCVQCDNFDLCVTCESQLVHPHHYMLRVPTPRPFNEVRSILNAVRKRIKILTDSGQCDGVDIKEEEDESMETKSEAALQDFTSVARAWTPNIALAHTHEHDIDTHALDDNEDQELNVSDASSEIEEEEAETAMSETKECEDDELEHTGLVALQTGQNHANESIIPDTEKIEFEQLLPPTEPITFVDPLSIREVNITTRILKGSTTGDTCKNTSQTTLPLDTSRKNIARKPASNQPLEHYKPRVVTLCRSEIELVCLDGSPPTNEESHGRVETQGDAEVSHGRLKATGPFQDSLASGETTENEQDSHGRVKLKVTAGDPHRSVKTKRSIEVDTDANLEQEIQQALDEIWSNDSIPTMKKTGSKRKPISLQIVPKRIKISNVEKEYSKIDTKIGHICDVQSRSKLNVDKNVGVEFKTNPKPRNHEKSKTEPKESHGRRLVSIVKRNVSNNVGLVSIIKLNLPNNVRLDSITEPNPNDIIGLAFKTKPRS